MSLHSVIAVRVWTTSFLWMLLYPGCVTGLRISAFNVQTFGQTKAGRADVMDILTKIVLRYDIIVIQEIRDIAGTAIRQLQQQVNDNSNGAFYNLTLSIRLGNTNSKEEYGFLYRTDRVKYLREHLYDEGVNNTFEREPFMIEFEADVQGLNKFVLGAIHIKPDTAVEELIGLTHVFDQAKTVFNTEDVMIMGDLNADCSYVSQRDWPRITLKSDPAFHWLIGDEIDTTVKSTDCAYDRLILTGSDFYSALVPGSAGIFRFDTEYGLSATQAERVSDHYPVHFELKDRPVDNVTDGENGQSVTRFSPRVLLAAVASTFGAWYHQRNVEL